MNFAKSGGKTKGEKKKNKGEKKRKK